MGGVAGLSTNLADSGLSRPNHPLQDDPARMQAFWDAKLSGAGQAEDTMLSIRLDADIERRLAELAKRTGRAVCIYPTLKQRVIVYKLTSHRQAGRTRRLLSASAAPRGGQIGVK